MTLDRQRLRAFVAEAIATELKVPLGIVLGASSLRGECGMDSIAAANVTFAIEDEFGVELEIAESDTFDSVESVVLILMRAHESTY